MKPSHRVRPVFDDPNLVSAAGLLPVLELAGAAGIDSLLAGLTVPSPNAVVKTTSLVAAMLAGADCIDDTDVLRHGGMGRVFTGIRAPSTLGTFLRAFTHGHVQQLDRAGAGLLGGLAARVPALLGNTSSEGPGRSWVFLDVDDTVREVHGYAKQATAFGYTGVRGLNIALATISSPSSAPVIARARLRRGNTASATGVGRLLAQAISTARTAGVGAPILARADSAYYGHAFVATALRHQVAFSVTARMTATVRTAIAGIDEAAWTPIRYPHAIFDAEQQRWISDAEVAEVAFTAFTGRRKAQHVPCRLVIRRVRRLQPPACDGSAQGELFATHRHHAFITNTAPDTLDTVAADQVHRGHAIVEQVIAELKDNALAHLPSGRYAANAAWVSCAVMAFNLARAAAVAATMPTARWATVRTRLITVPARIAATGRRLILHLPTHWPWATGWKQLWTNATGPPSPQPT